MFGESSPAGMVQGPIWMFTPYFVACHYSQAWPITRVSIEIAEFSRNPLVKSFSLKEIIESSHAVEKWRTSLWQIEVISEK